MKYLLDIKTNTSASLLFWVQRFLKYKLTSLSNAKVTNQVELSQIIAELNKNTLNIDDLKLLAKSARNIGLIGINTYINPLFKFYEYLDKFRLDSLKEIDEEFISDFLASSTANLADATKKNYKISTVAFFKYISKNNADDVNNSFIFDIELKNWAGLSSSKITKLPSYLKDEEIKRFLDAIEVTKFRSDVAAKNRLLIKIILYTGVRVSEALNILVKDVGFEDGYFTFFVRGKGNKPRLAMLKFHYIENDYNEWMKKRNDEFNYLFHSKSNKLLNQPYVSYIMDKILLTAGIKKEKNGAHMLRHTFATRLYSLNKDLVLVQEALGHADINTSRIYTHFDKDKLRVAANTMDDI